MFGCSKVHVSLHQPQTEREIKSGEIKICPICQFIFQCRNIHKTSDLARCLSSRPQIDHLPVLNTHEPHHPRDVFFSLLRPLDNSSHSNEFAFTDNLFNRNM